MTITVKYFLNCSLLLPFLDPTMYEMNERPNIHIKTTMFCGGFNSLLQQDVVSSRKLQRARGENKNQVK